MDPKQYFQYHKIKKQELSVTLDDAVRSSIRSYNMNGSGSNSRELGNNPIKYSKANQDKMKITRLTLSN